MKRSVVDLSPAELDKFARDAWANAARKALERGLPVTGSRDGRRFRYHPDHHVEDLGPVGGGLSTDQLLVMPNFDLPKFDFQDRELPEDYREIGSLSLSQAKDAYEKVKEVAQQATTLAELSTEFREGISGYQLKLLEITQANTVAAFDFVGQLMAARTFQEFVEISMAHTRAQLESLRDDAKELAELTRRIAETNQTKASGDANEKDSSKPSVA